MSVTIVFSPDLVFKISHTQVIGSKNLRFVFSLKIKSTKNQTWMKKLNPHSPISRRPLSQKSPVLNSIVPWDINETLIWRPPLQFFCGREGPKDVAPKPEKDAAKKGRETQPKHNWIKPQKRPYLRVSPWFPLRLKSSQNKRRKNGLEP